MTDQAVTSRKSLVRKGTVKTREKTRAISQKTIRFCGIIRLLYLTANRINAEKTAIIVRDNAGKVIENNEILLKNELIRRASLASIEVAKSQIINELNNNSSLHDKLIDESIEAIEGINDNGRG